MNLNSRNQLLGTLAYYQLMFVKEACLKYISKYLKKVSEFQYLISITDFNSELDYNPKVKYNRWLTGGCSSEDIRSFI